MSMDLFKQSGDQTCFASLSVCFVVLALFSAPELARPLP